MKATGTAILEELEPAAMITQLPEESQRQILLIEDSEDAKTLVEFALNTYGKGQYGLIWAKTLHDGLLKASGENVDMVLLDLGLPDSTGATSYSWVRSRTNDVPVVVLTADEDQETRDVVVAGGADNYLLKQSISGPLLVSAVEAALHARREKSAGPAGRSETDTHRVLLIEDDEFAMMLVQRALKELGTQKFQMEWESSLQSGLERLKRGDIDLVLLDLGLPDTFGITGYLQLRQSAPSVPVIVLTGSRDMEVEFALLASGADDYLDKCLTSGPQLIRSLQAVLQDTRSRQESRARGGRTLSNTFWGF